MSGCSLKIALVLAALGTPIVAADVLPRQTTFVNTTMPSTTSVTASGVPTPPPCCWILGGSRQVGVNRWYSSTAEHVVATVITTYIRENNGSAVPANSTTIYANTTGYPTAGAYGPSALQPWVAVPGVPSTLLPNVFQGGLDYARSMVDNVTAMTFPGTDLVVHQPTPFDVWFDLAIYTATPNTSAYPSQSLASLTKWPDTMCGYYVTKYKYDDDDYVTETITYNGELITDSRLTGTGTGIATASHLIPSEKDVTWSWTAALFGNPENGVHRLGVTYIEPKTTEVTDPRVLGPIPTGLRPWLGKQEDVVAEFPYITDCFTNYEGDGQPTLHIPVNALTVTSSHIIDVHRAPSSTTSPSAVDPTESARTEIEGTTLDVPPSPGPTTTTPTTSSSAVDPTESARTEIEGTTLDVPPSPSPTTSSSAVNPTESARTEIEGTTLDLPPPPPQSGTISIIEPPAATTTASAPRTENQGSSLDLPPQPPQQSGTTASRETSHNIPGMTIHTETKHTSSNTPKTTHTRQPKAHAEDSAPVLDAPTQPRPSINQPGSAIPVGTSDTAAGEETSGSKPGGVVVVDTDNDNNDDDDDENHSENDSEQAPSQGSGSSSNNNGEQGNDIGGLISAIQSVASQQPGGVSPGSQGNNQHDVSARPAATIASNGSGPRASPASSITGFVVGSRTLTPGGAAITQGGSTISALPSGSGLQIIAQSETLRVDGVVPAGNFAVPGVVQKPDSEDEYLVGNNGLSAGGSAVTIGRETFSALPSGSGVQVVDGDDKTKTQTVVAVASVDSSPVRSGEDDNNYVFGSNTLSAGGQALAIDGTTFSALPSLSGIVVVGGSEGQTSTVSVGGTVDFLTVTGASVTAFATPVLLSGHDNDDGDDDDDSNQRLVTLGGSTYTALATEASILVIGGQTLLPGATTVIHGETVVLSGTELVVAESTHGLGDAIISGIGGGPSSTASGDEEHESASSSSGPDAEETTGAPDNDAGVSDDTADGQSGAVPGVQVAFGCLVASAMFALALM